MSDISPNASEITPVYRTRSGRTCRRVERYEPDEDTVFIDEESNYSENEIELIDEDDEDEDDEGEYESSSGELSELEEVEDSSDEESLIGTESSMVADEEEDVDVLNWDTLTIDAESGDDTTEDEEEFDDDEEDAL